MGTKQISLENKNETNTIKAQDFPQAYIDQALQYLKEFDENPKYWTTYTEEERKFTEAQKKRTGVSE